VSALKEMPPLPAEVLRVDEARDLVKDFALEAARRVYPHAGEEAVRLMAQCLLARARDQLNKNPAGES
jgi:hypothetical protein